MKSVSQMIEDLGGRDAVAALTQSKPNAVRAWPRIGVPYKFWDLLVAEAKKQNVEGVTYAALMASKPRVAA